MPRNPFPIAAIGGSHLITELGDLGAGHFNPAKGLGQQLARSAEGTGIRVAPFLAKSNRATGKLEYKNFKGETIPTPSGHDLTPDTMTSTGFTSSPGDYYNHILHNPHSGLTGEAAKMPRVTPREHIHGMPDMDPQMSASEIAKLAPLGMVHPEAAAALASKSHQKTIRYGYKAEGPTTTLALSHSPYMTDEATRAAHAAINMPKERVISDILRHLHSQDPAAAGRLHKMILENPNLLPLMVTGSGRGDYTFSRALQLARANPTRPILTALGPHGKAIADVAGHLPSNVIPIHGNIPQAQYLGMRGALPLNAGPTSASEYSEALMLPSRNIVTSRGNEYRNLEQKLYGSKLPADIAKQHAAVDLPSWNRGQIEHARNERPAGFHVAENLDDVGPLSAHSLAVDSDEAIMARAKHNLYATQKARENASDYILKQTKDNWAKTSELWATEYAKTAGAISGVGVPAALLAVPGAFLGAGVGAGIKGLNPNSGNSYAEEAGMGAATGGILGALGGTALGLNAVRKLAGFGATGALRGAIGGGALGAGVGLVNASMDDEHPWMRNALYGGGLGAGLGALGGFALGKMSKVPTVEHVSTPPVRMPDGSLPTALEKELTSLPSTAPQASEAIPDEALQHHLAKAKENDELRKKLLEDAGKDLGF